MTLFALDGIEPTLPDAGDFWIADDANIIGNVIIGNQVSVWFGSTLRGDNEPITIGDGSNIQENCVIHTDPGYPFRLGRNCTVGHKAMLHGCIIGDNSLIGMGATILNGARIGSNAVVGAPLARNGGQGVSRILIADGDARKAGAPSDRG